jgi:hypothetical protein
MRKNDCIYTECRSNCGVCNVYQSNKTKNRDDLIMQFVYAMQKAENYFVETGNPLKKEAVIAEVEKELTKRERIVFNNECWNIGI